MYIEYIYFKIYSIYTFIYNILDIFKCVCIYIYLLFLFLFLAVPLGLWCFPGGTSGKELTCIAGDIEIHGFNPELGRSPGGGPGKPL